MSCTGPGGDPDPLDRTLIIETFEEDMNAIEQSMDHEQFLIFGMHIALVANVSRLEKFEGKTYREIMEYGKEIMAKYKREQEQGTDKTAEGNRPE